MYQSESLWIWKPIFLQNNKSLTDQRPTLCFSSCLMLLLLPLTHLFILRNVFSTTLQEKQLSREEFAHGKCFIAPFNSAFFLVVHMGATLEDEIALFAVSSLEKKKTINIIMGSLHAFYIHNICMCAHTWSMCVLSKEMRKKVGLMSACLVQFATQASCFLSFKLTKYLFALSGYKTEYMEG